MAEPASPDPQTFRIEIRDAGGGVRHLVLIGELDLAAAPELERRAAEALVGCECLVVDMSALTFLDSTGIRFLLRLRAVAEKDGWSLRLVPAPAEVQRVLEIAGVAELLPFLEEAPPPLPAP